MIPTVLPWTLIFRWGGAAVFVLLLLGAGFKCGVDRGDAKLEKANHELMVCGYDRNSLAEALNEVNAKAEQAKRDAAAQADLSAQLVELAKRDRKAYDAQMDAANEELEEARRSPTCRAQLEQALCASLH